MTECWPLSIKLGLKNCQPEYITVPGWETPTTDIKSYTDLPANAKGYIEKIESLVQIPISIISVGPDRNQTIFREPFSL